MSKTSSIHEPQGSTGSALRRIGYGVALCPVAVIFIWGRCADIARLHRIVQVEVTNLSST